MNRMTILADFLDMFVSITGMRHNEDGVPEDEENFEEAAKSVNTALTDHRIPSNLREILDHPLTNQLNNEVCGNVNV